jgi:hypothetical protein
MFPHWTCTDIIIRHLANLPLDTCCTLVSCSADIRPEDGGDTFLRKSFHIRTTRHYNKEYGNIPQIRVCRVDKFSFSLQIKLLLHAWSLLVASGYSPQQPLSNKRIGTILGHQHNTISDTALGADGSEGGKENKSIPKLILKCTSCDRTGLYVQSR